MLSDILVKKDASVEASRVQLGAVNGALEKAKTKLVELDKLDGTIRERKTELESINSDIQTLEGDLRGVEEKIDQANTTLDSTNDLIEQSKVILDGLQADFVTRKSKLDDEYREILLKTQDAVKRLKRIQDEESEILKGIATERQVISKERQSLNALQLKLDGTEARVKKLNGLIKL